LEKAGLPGVHGLPVMVLEEENGFRLRLTPSQLGSIGVSTANMFLPHGISFEEHFGAVTDSAGYRFDRRSWLIICRWGQRHILINSKIN